MDTIEYIARTNGTHPTDAEYELRDSDALAAALVLGLFCMALGFMVTLGIFAPAGKAIAWTWTGWCAFYFLASIPIVRWGHSRTLWCIWTVLMTLLAISCVLLFKVPLL